MEGMKALQKKAPEPVLEQPAPVAAPAAVPAEPIATAPRPKPAATREGKKRVTAILSVEDHRRLKHLSTDAGVPIEELMREAISDLFDKRGA